MRKIKFKNILTQVENSEYVTCPENEKYITVSSKGKGVKERIIKEGKTPASFLANRVKKGLLIYSKIGASDGAFGFVPDNLDDAVVSKDFPTFIVDIQVIDKQFLLYGLLSKNFRRKKRT